MDQLRHLLTAERSSYTLPALPCPAVMPMNHLIKSMFPESELGWGQG